MNWTSDMNVKREHRDQRAGEQTERKHRGGRRLDVELAQQRDERGQAGDQQQQGRDAQQLERVAEHLRQTGGQVDLHRHVRRRPGVEPVFAGLQQVLDHPRIGPAVVLRQELAQRVDDRDRDGERRREDEERDPGRAPGPCGGRRLDREGRSARRPSQRFPNE